MKISWAPTNRLHCLIQKHKRSYAMMLSKCASMYSSRGDERHDDQNTHTRTQSDYGGGYLCDTHSSRYCISCQLLLSGGERVCVLSEQLMWCLSDWLWSWKVRISWTHTKNTHTHTPFTQTHSCTNSCRDSVAQLICAEYWRRQRYRYLRPFFVWVNVYKHYIWLIITMRTFTHGW